MKKKINKQNGFNYFWSVKKSFEVVVTLHAHFGAFESVCFLVMYSHCVMLTLMISWNIDLNKFSVHVKHCKICIVR